MNVEEAKKLVKQKFPKHAIKKIRAVEKYFLMTIVAELTGKSQISKSDGLIAVDKKTKEVFVYNPIIAAKGGYD